MDEWGAVGHDIIILGKTAQFVERIGQSEGLETTLISSNHSTYIYSYMLAPPFMIITIASYPA